MILILTSKCPWQEESPKKQEHAPAKSTFINHSDVTSSEADNVSDVYS